MAISNHISAFTTPLKTASRKGVVTYSGWYKGTFPLKFTRLAMGIELGRGFGASLHQFMRVRLSNGKRSRSILQIAGSPAMAINGYRNKPIGPGEDPRRLHHKLLQDIAR